MSALDLDLKLRMPAEWETHEATWMAWPHDDAIWPNPSQKEGVERVFVEFISLLLQAETVCLLLNDEREEDHVRNLLRREPGDRLRFYHVRTVGPWIRDYGPIFVYSNEREVVATNWKFNAWGTHEARNSQDASVASQLLKFKFFKNVKPNMVLEGGAIDVNGAGLGLTTTKCLFDRNRNPTLAADQVEEILKKNIGIDFLIKLEAGLFGDDTGGHVDNVARFVNESTIVMAVSSGRNDPNREVLKKNWDLLYRVLNEIDGGLNAVQIPIPSHVTYDDRVIPASYLNFYVSNDVVVVPVYGKPEDGEAIQTLTYLFKPKKVIGIEASALALGSGAFHCVTQPEPLSKQ